MISETSDLKLDRPVLGCSQFCDRVHVCLICTLVVIGPSDGSPDLVYELADFFQFILKLDTIVH